MYSENSSFPAAVSLPKVFHKFFLSFSNSSSPKSSIPGRYFYLDCLEYFVSFDISTYSTFISSSISVISYIFHLSYVWTTCDFQCERIPISHFRLPSLAAMYYCAPIKPQSNVERGEIPPKLSRRITIRIL